MNSVWARGGWIRAEGRGGVRCERVAGGFMPGPWGFDVSAWRVGSCQGPHRMNSVLVDAKPTEVGWEAIAR